MDKHIIDFDPVIDAKYIIAFLENKPLPQNNQPHILLACFPKSGSTWFARLLAQTFIMRPASLVSGWNGREQELSILMAALQQNISYVAQHHVRYHPTTQRFLDIYHIRPIVQIRNIFDSVVSMVDHWSKVDFANGPMMYMDASFRHYSRDRLMDAAVEFCMPWYFNFYVSWCRANTEAMWVRYEDLLADPAGILRKVHQKYFPQLKIDDAVIQQAIEQAGNIDTRKNKAETGRGEELPEPLKNKIRHYASFYPDVDFSPIGL